MTAFPQHVLKPLSSDCSDHCPLLLQLQALGPPKRRFRFETFWVKCKGFEEVVERAWASTLDGVDPFRQLDHKLRNVALELRKWSNAMVGSVRLQLAMAREVIHRFDEQEESRTLDAWELDTRRGLKVKVLGLASLLRTIQRQRSRITFLREGDANTKIFHLQACHRRRQNNIHSLSIQGLQLVADHAMADALYSHYVALLGTDFNRSRRMNMAALGLPSLDLQALEMLHTGGSRGRHPRPAAGQGARSGRLHWAFLQGGVAHHKE